MNAILFGLLECGSSYAWKRIQSTDIQIFLLALAECECKDTKLFEEQWNIIRSEAAHHVVE